jgi:NCAIR mutase (PurE)-related protein
LSPRERFERLDQVILRELLVRLSKGEIDVEKVFERLRTLPFEDLGFARIDHHRGLRRGHPEVVFGEGKDVEDIIQIAGHMLEKGDNVLLTRLSPEKAQNIKDRFPDGTYYVRSRTLTIVRHPVEVVGRGPILVMSAGTSDIPVAEEASVTARFMGNDVEAIFDVGVSGLHRILSYKEELLSATVIVVAAGMEGALPSVVSGLVDKPVIAVPTSVGYGASFGGLTALLAMLNSCASGVTVVNIDNGFGAGYAASVINRK